MFSEIVISNFQIYREIKLFLMKDLFEKQKIKVTFHLKFTKIRIIGSKLELSIKSGSKLELLVKSELFCTGSDFNFIYNFLQEVLLGCF